MSLIDVAAEIQVLGAAMLDATVVPDLRCDLQPADFGDPRSRAVWQAMLGCDDAHEPIEPLAVLAAGKRLGVSLPEPFVTGIATECMSATSAGYYAATVRALAMRRALLGAAEGITAATNDPSRTDTELLDAASAAVFAAQTVRGDDGTRTQAAVLAEWWRDVERASQHHDGVTGIGSGFASIDRTTTGWHAGDLVVVAARPGTGKSTIGLHFARMAARMGMAVVFVSCEMTAQALMSRMVASYAGVAEAAVASGQATDDDLARAADAAGELSALPITWVEPTDRTVTAVRMIARRLAGKGRCDLLILDQLGNLTPSKPRENRVQQVAEFSAGMKQLAREIKAPVIVMHQLSRNVEHRGDGARPTLSDLRDSGTVEQDADQVLLLHRPWSSKDGRTDGPVDVDIAKNRRGATRTVPLRWQGTLTRFSEPVLGMVVSPSQTEMPEDAQ